MDRTSDFGSENVGSTPTLSTCLDTNKNNLNTMELSQAVHVLQMHNKWRRGSDSEMTDPTTLGVAIDTVVSHLSYFTNPTFEVDKYSIMGDIERIQTSISAEGFGGYHEYDLRLREELTDYILVTRVVRSPLGS